MRHHRKGRPTQRMQVTEEATGYPRARPGLKQAFLSRKASRARGFDAVALFAAVVWLLRPLPPRMPHGSAPDLNVTTACLHFSMRFTVLKLIA